MKTSKLRGTRLLNWGLSQTWMATPLALQAMLNVVSAAAEIDLSFENLQAVQKTPAREDLSIDFAENPLNFTELLSDNGKTPDWTKNTGIKIVNRVAIIPIEGVIYRYADFFTDMCGGVTTERLSREIRSAKNDPSVDAIVLHIDSPGGEAYSIGELAHQIRQTNEEKPVISYGDGDVCSAAYYLAVAAGRLVVSPSAFVGCIGTIARVPNPELETGPKPYINIVSSQSPKKVPDLTTEEGMNQIRTSVDDLAAEFILDVATFRDTTIEDVMQNYGQGDILIGRKALTAGMVDAVGTLDDVLEEIYASRTMEVSRKAGTSMAKEETVVAEREIVAAVPAPLSVTEATTPPQLQFVGPSEPSAETLELRRRVAEYEAADLRAAAKAKDDRIVARAAEGSRWAAAEILSGRSLPAEEEALIQGYVDADTDDEAMGPYTLADGSHVTRVARLQARHALRSARDFTTEEVPVIPEGGLRILENNVETPNKDPNAPLNLDDRRKALSATASGRSILAREDKEAKV